jgi:hypothetical protein
LQAFQHTGHAKFLTPDAHQVNHTSRGESGSA